MNPSPLFLAVDEEDMVPNTGVPAVTADSVLFSISRANRQTLLAFFCVNCLKQATAALLRTRCSEFRSVHNLGTVALMLTQDGANMCSCCRPEKASALTTG